MSRHLTLLTAALFATLASTGCTALDMNPAGLFSSSGPASAEDVPGGPSVQVDIQAASGKSRRVYVPLQSGMHVQQAMDQSGASKSFRRMTIQLIRSTPEGRRQKLNVVFDRGRHQVDWAYDYALQPEDRLLVLEDTSTSIDDMLESVAGPLGRILK